MKYKVLCFGSATFDNYLLSDDFMLKKSKKGVLICQMYGSKVEISESIITTGGGATNTAVCFERLGIQTGILACLGKDYWGKIVRKKLEEEGVSLVHIQQVNNKKTSSSVFLVGKDGGRTVLVHRAASNLLSEKKIDWKRLDADWVYCSSLGGNFELLKQIISFCGKKNIKIAFNPGKRELKEKKKISSFLHYINILILNKEELKLLTGNKINENSIGSLGAEIVIVTEGKKGASAYLKNGKVIRQKTIKIKTVEETGAGDAFGSSFVAGIIKNMNIRECLEMAAYNSASVVSKIGPKEGLLFWPEIKKKLKKSK